MKNYDKQRSKVISFHVDCSQRKGKELSNLLFKELLQVGKQSTERNCVHSSDF